MYQISKGTELNIAELAKILMSFQTLELPRLQNYKNYYDGKQAILQKVATDTGKPCNHIVTNYCKSIVNNYSGYISGVPIQYSNTDDAVLDVLKYNDVKSEDTDLLKNALIYGVAYEINYIDGDGKQRFKVLDSRECIPVYDDTLDNVLRYVIRFYQVNLANNQSPTYRVEVYGESDTKIYLSTAGFMSFNIVETKKHVFNQVPVSVFELNAEKESIFAQVMSLQDAYNTLLSSEVDDWESFCDSYLVLKGIIADEADLDEMKQKRCIQVDTDSDVSYLLKDVNDAQIQNLLKTVNDQIYNKANCVDFNDENFQASTGIALKLKLVGFENNASMIESQFKKALQKRIELIVSVLRVKNGEAEWRDVTITFTRNIPTILSDTVDIVNSLRGLVSDETLLSLLPFVTDVEEEKKRIAEQKQANIMMYNFNEDN